MSVQWFPGHMHKARKALAAALPKVDVVVEVLDARAPIASSNPLLNELCGKKPRIRLLSKADLADPKITQQWRHALTRPGVDVLALSLTKNAKKARQDVIKQCRKLAPPKPVVGLRALVVGIPNVGKSTLINVLVGRQAARTGDEAALTRGSQLLRVQNDFWVADTPGLLWPKITDESDGLCLALCGAFRETVLPSIDAAHFGLALVAERYPQAFLDRYGVAIDASAEASLETLGQRRGCLQSGGRVDLERAAKVFLRDLRVGALGPISFQRPEA